MRALSWLVALAACAANPVARPGVGEAPLSFRVIDSLSTDQWKDGLEGIGHRDDVDPEHVTIVYVRREREITEWHLRGDVLVGEHLAVGDPHLSSCSSCLRCSNPPRSRAIDVIAIEVGHVRKLELVSRWVFHRTVQEQAIDSEVEAEDLARARAACARTFERRRTCRGSCSFADRASLFPPG